MSLSVYFVTPDSPDDDLVLAALRGGASIIQLRDKHASNEEMIAQAKRLKAHCSGFGVPLVINDRLEVALQSNADGLHIGQSDGDPLDMRMALGPGKILGLSIENHVQLEAMARLPVGIIDYIGAGPVRATATKDDHAPPFGFEDLGCMCRASPVPTVAIGGIGQADIPALKRAGCEGMAVVSAIASALDPESATRQLLEAWRST